MTGFIDSAGGDGNGASSYQILHSVRLAASRSCYFSRTFGAATDGKKWTLSFKAKRGIQGSGSYTVFGSETGGEQLFFDADGLNWYAGSGGTYNLITSRKFRDPSAHLNCVLAYDSTQATAADRMKLYIDNTQETAFSSSAYPTLNFVSGINAAVGHTIGKEPTASTRYFDGLISEIHFIDGQALDPSYFGELNSDGVWVPKAYTGTFGANGFFLDFSDGSSTTTLGEDRSGNSNNWTCNNISLTAGVTYDHMVDTPSVNFATLNPLKSTGGTFSNANLGIVRSGAATVQIPNSTVPIPSDMLFYAEITPTTSDMSYGVALTTSNSGANGIVGSSSDASSWGAYVSTDASYRGFWNNNTRTAFDFSGGTVYQLALNRVTGKIWFGKDGTWYNSGNPEADTNPTYSGISSSLELYLAVLCGAIANVNFGQRPFSYPIGSTNKTTGFLALSTANLPAVAIPNPREHFDVVTRTGTGAAATISTTVDLSQGGLLWEKARNAAHSHFLVDSVRGIADGTTQYLSSNLTNAESTANWFKSFGNGNFQTNSNDWSGAYTLVDWLWKANGAGVSNTDGSITSTVSANQTAGFSIVTFTAPSSGNFTAGHGLGTTPALVIVKSRTDAAAPWYVWHNKFSNLVTDYLRLNGTTAVQSGASQWGASGHTSTTLGLAVANSVVANTTTVAYCFSETTSFSKAFSFTGNANADGTHVDLGFLPALVLLKCSSTTGNWYMLDTVRNTINPLGEQLYPNLANAGSTVTTFDATSRGIKLRLAGDPNAAQTYIGFAWARHPFGGSNVAPCPAF
jgi:hypothetical protein